MSTHCDYTRIRILVIQWRILNDENVKRIIDRRLFDIIRPITYNLKPERVRCKQLKRRLYYDRVLNYERTMFYNNIYIYNTYDV